MRYISIIVLLLITISSFSQEIKKVEATYVYGAPDNITLAQAKQIALERAQLQAIADTFGTNISQQNSTQITNKNGNSDIDFFSISSSDVNGEWIETIGDPEYEDPRYEQNMLIITCHVKGKIRKIERSTVEFSAKILRNGVEDKFEDTDFHVGDDMYLSFQSPVDGYLAVYLIGPDNNAYCLLPYANQRDGIYKISANKHYLFFSYAKADPAEKDFIDEYTMTCESETETNQIYIIFSPHQFYKAVDVDMGDILPRETDGEDFQKWLAKVRRKDTELVLTKTLIKINR